MSKNDDRGLGGIRPEVATRKVARLRATVGRIAAEQVEQLRAGVEVAEECAARRGASWLACRPGGACPLRTS